MSKLNLTRTIGVFLIAVFATISMAPVATEASTTGRRNTALGLSAAAVYSALRGKGTSALALGAGAAYAWKREADSKRHHSYYRHHHASRYEHYRR